MTQDRYAVEQDPYCYRGSRVLRNRLGLRDDRQLAAVEAELTVLRRQEALPVGRLDTAHYRRLHRYIFQDVYSWAGKYRSVQMGKGGSPFCHPQNIAGEMDRLFQSLRDKSFLRGLTSGQFFTELASFLAYLNAIHPFREGNGRTQNHFIAMVAEAAGHPIDVSRIEARTYLPAIIESFSGSEAPLTTVLAKLAITHKRRR